MAKKTNGKEKEFERRFPVPLGFRVSTMAEDLGLWLKNSRGKRVDAIRFEGGIVLEIHEAEGRFQRIVKRKQQLFHLILTLEDNRLFVGLGNGAWTGAKTDTEESGGFFLKKAAKYAMDTASELADAAADSVADVLTEKKTRQEIFDFIAQYVANSYKNLEGDDGDGPFGPLTDFAKSRYAERLDGMQSSWMTGHLADGEMPLAWLHTATDAPGSGTGEWIWLLTTRRSGLVCFSSAGFESFEETGATSLEMSDSFGRDMVKSGELEWKTRMGNEDLFREISILLPLGPEERLFGASRLNFVHAKDNPERLRYCISVLSHLKACNPSPIFRLSLLLVEHALRRGDAPLDNDDATLAAFSSLALSLAEDISGEDLREWARDWRLSPPQLLSVIELIQKTSAESGRVAELVRPGLTDVREQFLKKNKNDLLLGVIDIRYAENLVACGYHKEAKAVLESRLAKLPDESLADLLPAGDSDLTKGEGGQVVKTRILEVLLRARKPSEGPDPALLRQLAMRQPLVPSRLEQLAKAAGETLRKRASACLYMLESGQDRERWAFHEDNDPQSAVAAALKKEMLEEKIRHPASRSGATLNKIQGMIASKKIPDHSSLKSFAKRVTMDEHPELCSAILDAGVIFGVKFPEAFISFGEYNTGVRGYESSPPFILIGNEHLVPGSPREMVVDELKFLVGAEIANLKFEYNRITSADIWEGAFEKTISVMELVPVIGGYLGKLSSLGKFARQAQSVTGAVGNVQQYVSHAWGLASKAQDLYKKGDGNREKKDDKDKSTAVEEAKIIGAFREMRLTTDRAGLVLCGDVKAAVRAIFKSSPRFRDLLATAEKNGLDSFLSEKDENGELKYQNLAIRLAALFSFYLSEDYAQLRSAAYSQRMTRRL